MRRGGMRWMIGWLVLCLLIALVFVGFAEEMEIGSPDKINVDGNMRIESRGILRFDKKVAYAYLDLNGWIDGKPRSDLGKAGTADVYISGKRVANGVNNYIEKWPVGTSYEIKDIRAKSGYSYHGVFHGSLSGKVGKNSTRVVLRFDKKKVAYAYLDLNGWIDGKSRSDLGKAGTADVYINGKRVANDVNNYIEKWPVGTLYEIKDIRAKSGYSYHGVFRGSLSGKVWKNSTRVVLRFDNKSNDGEFVKNIN